MYIISALAGYGEDGSGELDDGKEADQHLMINNDLQKTVYIASTIKFISTAISLSIWPICCWSYRRDEKDI